jgi:uncharacterized RDD family membrane protein YckC
LSDAPPWSPYDASRQPAQSDAAYAGWWPRVAATFIDGLFSVLFSLPALVLGVVSFAAGHDGSCSTLDGGTRSCRQPNGALIGLAVLAFIAGLVTFGVLYCRMTGRTGQSWGRRAQGYRIVDAATLQPIGAGRVFVRQLVAGFVDGIFYLGYLWPLWDKKHQKWSDKIMNTIAVRG